ncbi:MAG: hypothetical protein LUG52_00630 [Clostridia bacterium]|nr:hypothetical protein [Clostridia bacterium]
MDYEVKVCRLSTSFYKDYPKAQFPEILGKEERPYTCLLIETQIGYIICIPFRSSITHNDAFLFKKSKRSGHSRSGLDYQKIVIVENTDYIDSENAAVVDNDEYVEMITNIRRIIDEAIDYIMRYVSHVSGKVKLHGKEYLRHYRFSTLPYFQDILISK